MDNYKLYNFTMYLSIPKLSAGLVNPDNDIKINQNGDK